jgi:hypothetical protein
MLCPWLRFLHTLQLRSTFLIGHTLDLKPLLQLLLLLLLLPLLWLNKSYAYM